VFDDEQLSYAQAFERVAALAASLQASGVKKGERVALAMRNFPEWVISFWAASCTGAVVVPLNAWWKAGELAYGLLDSRSRVLICDEERAQAIESQLPETEVQHVIVARATAPLPDSMLRFEDAIEPHLGAPLPEVAIEPLDDATIFYTSGTTGRPKGAVGTHLNMCTNVGSSMFSKARTALRRGDALPAPNAAVGGLLSVPLFHVTGSHSGMAASTYQGNKIVMLRKWQPERALELIERERLSAFGGVPSMVWQVLESPDLAKRDTSSVAAVGYGVAPAAPELVRRIKQAFPGSSASNGYGLTETSAITCTNSGVDYERKPDSVGVPMPICDVKIVDSDGHELPHSEVGELWIRGPNVVRGYYGKPEATAQSFSEGWLHSGDIARIDDEGFVYILDRAKDMLIRGGENVYCVEVEDVLYGHPAVMDAAVIGIPHRVLGEEVGAVVQVAPGTQTSQEELQAYAREQLAGFKVPVRIELRNEPLPRNPNGKILKRDLKKQLGWV
jgi:long-chain acyl-CoA synthetase